MKYFTVDDFNIVGHERVGTVNNADVFITKGGDGTIIEALSFLVKNDALNVAMLGVNTGHVGFLSNDLSFNQLSNFLTSVEKCPTGYISKRRLIKVTSRLKNFYGINEVAIQPSTLGRLFTTNVEVNNYPITYQGDGLVVSTTSGSTAYNLSAGGPIIFPEVEAMCLTPLNPFSLASRPLVVPIKSVIEIKSQADCPNITVDGYPTGLRSATIQMSSKQVSLVKIKTFMEDIQDKLGWNRNIKN